MGTALAVMADPADRSTDLPALMDRVHFLNARIVVAGVEVHTAQAAADAANTAAEAAFVDGSTEAIRKADAAADAASAAFAKARKNAAALERARGAALDELRPAAERARMALRLAADAQIHAIEGRYKAAALKLSAIHAEAVAIGLAVNHPNAGILAMLTIPADFTPGSAPLMAGHPDQALPVLPKMAAPLVEAAEVLRLAERVLAAETYAL